MTITLHHKVSDIGFEGQDFVLAVDGQTIRLPLNRVSSVLLNASSQQKNHFEVSASGYGIHWPELDEDLSIDGLLRLSRSL